MYLHTNPSPIIRHKCEKVDLKILSTVLNGNRYNRL